LQYTESNHQESALTAVCPCSFHLRFCWPACRRSARAGCVEFRRCGPRACAVGVSRGISLSGREQRFGALLQAGGRGWHIYGRTLADAGEPPHIQWTLPAGITAGPMQFPAPKRLPLGPLMDYGYEDEVLFFRSSWMRPRRSRPVKLWFHGPRWICWFAVASCIPGKAELETSFSCFPRRTHRWRLCPRRMQLFQAVGTRTAQISTPSAQARFPTHANRFPPSRGNRQARKPKPRSSPADQDILDNPAPQKLTPTATGLILD